jgi:hypothetical protein
MVIIEVLRSVGSRRKGEPMALIRLELHEHPAPPHHEMRQKSVLDSGDRFVGTVANLYIAWKESTIWSLPLRTYRYSTVPS